MSVLRVTPATVEQSGGQVAGVPSAAVPAAQVTAAASDPVSVSVAYALGTRIAVIGAQTSTAHAEAQQAAARLNANAADYATQEQANTTGLGVGAAPAVVGVSTHTAPTPTAPLALPAPQSATTPATGKQIAELIHGGPGPDPLHQAATGLRTHADQLADTSAQLRSAATNLRAGWFSDAGDAAQGRILELADFYDRHAQTTAATATDADTQADNVSRARSASRVQRNSNSSNRGCMPQSVRTRRARVPTAR